MFVLTVRRIGNSSGVILPRPLLATLNANDADTVVADATPQGIAIFAKRKARTLGLDGKATEFVYSGTSESGVMIHFKSGATAVPKEIFSQALTTFSGKSVVGGFNMSGAPPASFGEWLVDYSAGLLNPRHASFVAAILANEQKIKHHHDGNAVILDFP